MVSHIQNREERTGSRTLEVAHKGMNLTNSPPGSIYP